MSGAKVSKTTGGLGAVDSRDFREQVASWLVSLARAARAEQAVVDAELDTSRLFCTRALQLLSSLRQYVEDETSAVLDGVLSSRKQLCGCVRADPQLCRQCHLKRMAAAVREVCSVVSPSAPPLVSLGATEEGLSCATELAALRQSVPAPGPSKTAREAGRSASSSGRHERGGGSEFASFSPRAVLQLHGLQRVEAALSVLRRAAKTDVVASCLEQRLPAWHQRCLLVRALFCGWSKRVPMLQTTKVPSILLQVCCLSIRCTLRTCWLVRSMVALPCATYCRCSNAIGSLSRRRPNSCTLTSRRLVVRLRICCTVVTSRSEKHVLVALGSHQHVWAGLRRT